MATVSVEIKINGQTYRGTRCFDEIEELGGKLSAANVEALKEVNQDYDECKIKIRVK